MPAPLAFRCSVCCDGVACHSSSGAPAATPGPTGFHSSLTKTSTIPGQLASSGLSLGEAHLHAKHNGANWSFTFVIDAGVPGYAVKDTYHSSSVPDFCTASFERNTTHGSRTAEDKETVDRDRSTVSRGDSF